MAAEQLSCALFHAAVTTHLTISASQNVQATKSPNFIPNPFSTIARQSVVHYMLCFYPMLNWILSGFHPTQYKGLNQYLIKFFY